MKKVFRSLMLVFIFVLAFVLVGCNDKKDTEPVDPIIPPVVDPVEPVVPETITTVLTVDALQAEAQKYTNGKATVEGIDFDYIEVGNYGNGIQMRSKTTPTVIKNTTAYNKINEVKIMITEGKAGYANEGALKLDFSNENGEAVETILLNTQVDVLEYVLTPTKDAKFVTITHNMKYSFYCASITIVANK